MRLRFEDDAPLRLPREREREREREDFTIYSFELEKEEMTCAQVWTNWVTWEFVGHHSCFGDCLF